MKNKIIILLNLLLLVVAVSAQQQDIYKITLNWKKTINGGILSLIDVQTSEGAAVDYKLSPANSYKLEIFSSNNEVLKSTNFVVPVGAVLGLSHAKAEGTPNDLNFTVSVPYFDDATTINIYDQSNNKVLEIPVRQQTKLIWFYISAPILIIILFLVYVEVKRKKDNADIVNKNKQQRAMYIGNYVAANLRKGYTKEQIRNSLAKAGYTDNEIQEVFKGLK